MSPLFGKKQEDNLKQKINEILSSEKVLKKGEYKLGYMYLTTNHLIWDRKKWKSGRTEVIPLESIKLVEPKHKLGRDWFLKVTFYQSGELEDKLFHMTLLNKVNEWVSILSGLHVGKSVSIMAAFDDIIYAGDHSAFPRKHNGELYLEEKDLIFEGDKRDDLELIIPFQKIENLSIKTTSEINLLRTILAGPLWSMAYQDKNKFVLVEYVDKVGMKQTPLFDFPGDSGDEKKEAFMQILYEKIKKNKVDKTETQTLEEDPTKVLKLRYVKGEISKEEYEEMKKVLEK